MRAVDKSVTLGYKWATESEGEQMPWPVYATTVYATTSFTPQTSKFKVGDRVELVRKPSKGFGTAPGVVLRYGVIYSIPGLNGDCGVRFDEWKNPYNEGDSHSCEFAQLDKLPDYSTSSSSPRVTPSALHPETSSDLAFFSRCTSPGACEKCAGPKPCAYHG